MCKLFKSVSERAGEQETDLPIPPTLQRNLVLFKTSVTPQTLRSSRGGQAGRAARVRSALPGPITSMTDEHHRAIFPHLLAPAGGGGDSDLGKAQGGELYELSP